MRPSQKMTLKKAPNWWKDRADPVPVEVPADMKQPETMDDRIKRIIREQISPMAQEMGEESLEESNDYDVEDDFESGVPKTMYEETEMVPEYIQETPTEEVKKEEVEVKNDTSTEKQTEIDKKIDNSDEKSQ